MSQQNSNKAVENPVSPAVSVCSSDHQSPFEDDDGAVELERTSEDDCHYFLPVQSLFEDGDEGVCESEGMSRVDSPDFVIEYVEENNVEEDLCPEAKPPPNVHVENGAVEDVAAFPESHPIEPTINSRNPSSDLSGLYH